ncbi:hypothetical protein [Pseudomonas sp. MPB26]
MALSDTTFRHARITGNDYTIGDTDDPGVDTHAQAICLRLRGAA